MIYIFTALYPEAKPLIRAFSLKKAVAGLPFDVYENMDGDLRLVITGAGMTAAGCRRCLADTERAKGII